MAGFQTASVGNITVQRGRPVAPMVDIRLVRPQVIAEPAPARLGEIKPGGLRTVTGATIVLMRQMRAQGKSLHEIAGALATSHTTVRRHTRDVPAPEGGWKTGARETRVPVEKAKRMKRAGFTYAEIAEDLGICQATIWNQLNSPPRKALGGGSRMPVARSVQQISRLTGFTCAQLRRDKASCGGKTALKLAFARHLLFWCLVRGRGLSLLTVANSLGGYDHSTIQNGATRIDEFASEHGISPGKAALPEARILWAARTAL